MVPFRLGELPIQLPTSWDDITTWQMMRIKDLPSTDLTNPKTYFKLLEILSGAPAQDWFDCELTNTDIELLNTALEFLRTPLDFRQLPLPETIQFGDKQLTIPKDLNVKPYGQLVVFGMTIDPAVKRTGDVVVVLDQALAIFLQTIYTGGKFDSDNLEPFIQMARQTRVVEAYPVAAFFMRPWMPSTPTKTNASPRSKSNTRISKSKPASRRSTPTES